MKKKVLILLHHLGLGGIEVQLSRSLPQFQDAQYQLDFCCTGPRSQLDDFISAQGSKIYRIPRTPNCYKTAVILRELLRRQPYEIVHSQFGLTSGGVCLGAAKARVPCLVSIHSDRPTALSSWEKITGLNLIRSAWLAWHNRLMVKHCSIFLGHSRTNLDLSFPGWSTTSGTRARFRLVRNGVAFPEFLLDRLAARAKLNLKSEEVAVLHVGNFTPYKNQEGALVIFEKLRRDLPKSRLLLVGDGPTRPVLQQRTNRGPLRTAVRFEGQKQNPWEYYSAADLLIFPSLHEGFGNVLVEAQGVGLPIVASDIPAHREAVCIEQHRFLFETTDYTKGAALSLEQIKAAQSGVAGWVSAAREFARKNHSLACFVQDSIEAYEHALRLRM